jgi:CPA2 family monovalent cation:H+ antiporter-2
MLAQIGEFSFILVSVGLQAALVTRWGYQMTIAVISLSLILSPIWISGMKKLTKLEIST